MKISKNWLTQPVFAILQAFRKGLVGAVGIQNTSMASYMILDTSQEYSKAKAIVIAWS